MAENRDFGGSQEEAGYWPPIDENSTPRYQPPNFYKNFAASSRPWDQPDSIPVDVLKQAEERVNAQKRFFKHLFIYLGVVMMVWLFGAAIFLSHSGTDRYMAVFFPLFVTLIGGIRVAYSFFNAFIWLRKSHRERVMQEAHRLMM